MKKTESSNKKKRNSLRIFLCDLIISEKTGSYKALNLISSVDFSDL